MSQYFPKPYEPFGGYINVKVDLSNYATKADIKRKGDKLYVKWKGYDSNLIFGLRKKT